MILCSFKIVLFSDFDKPIVNSRVIRQPSAIIILIKACQVSGINSIGRKRTAIESDGKYDFNTKYLHYSEDIRIIIRRNMDILINMIKKGEAPFNKQSVMEWYDAFLEKQKNKQ